MPNSRLGFYLHSPLVRNPSLLVRKIRERAGWLPAFAFTAPPESFTWKSDEATTESIRAWSLACGPLQQPPSRDEVFGHVFDHQNLLEWCRDGVAKGEGLEHDIKVPWEFSRSYTMPLRALMADTNTAPALARQLAAEISEWMETCDNQNGPMWTNAMEVAIRAINWIIADDVLHGDIRAEMGDTAWKNALWRHGCAIEARIEARLISSNHYLANLLGLLVIGTHAAYPRWSEFAFREFPAAVRGQSFPDGGAYEASLPYHALITEMALLYVLICGKRCPAAFRRHASRMTKVIFDTCRAGGDVFPVGDDDSGRIVAMDRIMASPGRGKALVSLAGLALNESFQRKATATVYPASGWWIGRNDGMHILLEFGGVGFAGKGAHAHNDRLSLCVDWKGEAVLIDPGSYLYTGSPASRNRFRSTAVHNVLTIDEQEQLPLSGESVSALFSLPGPDRPATLLASSPDSITVVHTDQGIRHERTVQMHDHELMVRDRLTGHGRHWATWCFHLAHGVSAERRDNRTILLTTPGKNMLALSLGCDGNISISDAEFSPSYGQCLSSTLVNVTCETTLPQAWTWKISAA